MDSKNKQNKLIFWGAGATLLAVFVGSAYYLYNLMSPEEELPEEEENQIEEIKKESSSNGELTVEIAIKIMSIITKISEEIYKKNNPDLDEKRRNALDDQPLYEQLFQQSIQEKEIGFMEASNKVMPKFGHSFEKIQEMLQSKHPLEIEKLSHLYEKMNFDKNSIPEKKLVKEAFIFHGRRFRSEMIEVQKEMQQIGMQDQQFFFFKMMLAKTKVDDITYKKFELTEQQMKYLLFEYDLLSDPEVKKVYEQMMNLEGMYGGMAQ
jgi:hypothetical protein